MSRPYHFAIVIAVLLAAVPRAEAQEAAPPPATAPRALLIDSLRWVDNPAIPKGGQIAVLLGSLSSEGFYAFRVRFPPRYRIMPHTHPEDRMYTVIEGMWVIGIGETFDTAKLTAYPPGTVYFLPAGTPHFHGSGAGGSIAQINAVGPTATVYVRPEDDPRGR